MIPKAQIRKKAEEQLLRLIAEGDIRAIKLYYDLSEQKDRRRSAEKATLPDMEEMAAIRRAVFGDDIFRKAVSAAEASAAETVETPSVGCIPLNEDTEDADMGGDDI